MFSSGASGYAFLARSALLTASYVLVLVTAAANERFEEEDAGVAVGEVSESSIVQQMVLPSRSEVRSPLTKSG